MSLKILLLCVVASVLLPYIVHRVFPFLVSYVEKRLRNPKH